MVEVMLLANYKGLKLGHHLSDLLQFDALFDGKEFCLSLKWFLMLIPTSTFMTQISQFFFVIKMSTY